MTDDEIIEARTEAKAVQPWWVKGEEIEIPILWLVIEAGPDAGNRYRLGARTTIGRDDWCDIGLSDTRVSKEHCELAWTKKGMRLRDLDSTNGVEVEGNFVHDITLTKDYRFQIGGTSLRVAFDRGTQKMTSEALDPTHSLVGASPVMQRLFASMTRMGLRDLPVLLLGETGTGKSVVAEVIHKISRRSKAPFVAVNCATLPKHLVESTLFGHMRGAFTGAEADHDGLFVQAHGGTVFLDEIGEMPEDAQATLLRVLDTKLVRPVGARREIPVDFRLLCATNRDLLKDVRDFRFREDLYHRIKVAQLTIPPLRERASDIPKLAQWFTYNTIQRLHAAGQECVACGISSDAMRKLMKYSWPGNVRELENAVVSAVNIAEGFEVEADDLVLGEEPARPAQPSPVSPPQPDGKRPMTFPELWADEEVREKALVVDLLARTGGNVKRAAEVGGLSLSHLKNLILKHGLKRKG